MARRLLFKCRTHVRKIKAFIFDDSPAARGADEGLRLCTRWLSQLYVLGGDGVNPVCRAPKAAQQGNCILIQSTPVCISVIQQSIVSGICIRAMKFSPLAL